MGLLMFREPEAGPTKSAIKADPTVSARSLIRRHRRILNSSRNRRSSPGIDHNSLFEIIRRDRARDREDALASSETLEPSAASGISSEATIDATADIARTEASNRRRFIHGRALLRDSLSYERPSIRMRHPRARESALRYEMSPPMPPRPLIQPGSTTESLPPYEGPAPISNERRPPVPTYARSGQSHRAEDLPSTGPRTRHFAPAYRFSEPGETYHIEERLRSTPEGVEFRETLQASMRNGLNELNATPIRRTRRPGVFPFSEEDLVPLYVEGFSGPRRSFSPEENTWETLLTTITPDERLPSAESSFTSATASASASSSFSSNATRQTAPSSASEPLNVYPNICDDPTDMSCSDTDDDSSPPPERTQRRRSLRGYSSSQPQAVDYEISLSQLSPQLMPDGRLIRVTPNPNIELEQMHIILERMERQEPVPDTWWAAAGLARNLDRVGLTTMELERERL